MFDLNAVISGNRLAISRLLTEVENDTDFGHQAMDKLFPGSGHAHLLGITGAPGTGKSTLVTCLALELRRIYHKTIAIVAVDPSSPFSGGAILGDRVRMRDLAGDEGVFIRSMATRGELGGLARATASVVQVLDAAGFDMVIVETVGAGQNEVDIARLAHTTIVVDSPGMGDDIQAIKAGILEIADILVINKADHPGVENTERALRANLDLGYSHPRNHDHNHMPTGGETEEPAKEGWVPPVLRTIATLNQGIAQVVSAVLQHREYLEKTGLLASRDQERLRSEVKHQLQAGLVNKWKEQVSNDVYESMLQDVFDRKYSPRAAAEELIKKTSYN